MLNTVFCDTHLCHEPECSISAMTALSQDTAYSPVRVCRGKTFPKYINTMKRANVPKMASICVQIWKSCDNICMKYCYLQKLVGVAMTSYCSLPLVSAIHPCSVAQTMSSGPDTSTPCYYTVVLGLHMGDWANVLYTQSHGHRI